MSPNFKFDQRYKIFILFVECFCKLPISTFVVKSKKLNWFFFNPEITFVL